MVGLYTPGAHFTRRSSMLALPSPSPGYAGSYKEYRRLLEDFDDSQISSPVSISFLSGFTLRGILRAGSL